MSKKNETKYSNAGKGDKSRISDKKSMTETTRKSSEWTWEELMEMGHS